MKKFKMNQFRFLIFAVLYLIISSANGVEPIVKYINNIDSTKIIKDWQVKKGAKINLGYNDNSKLTNSKSIQIKFKATKKNISQVVFFRIPNSIKDWRKFETLEFEIFHKEKSTKYKITVCHTGVQGAYMLIPSYRRGKVHCVIALDNPTYKRTDKSKISCLYFLQRTPAKKMELEVGRFKLVDYTPVRIAHCIKILKVLLSESKSNMQLKWLHEKFKKYSTVYSHHLDVKKLNAIITEVNNASEKIRQLIKLSMLNQKNLALKAELLYELNNSCERHNKSITYNTQTLAQKEKQKKNRFITNQINRFKAYKKYISKANSESTNEDFFVGISEYPKVYENFPITFDGNFNKTIKLSAARGEYEPFQILILPKSKDIKDIKIKASDLSGQGKISRNNVEIAPMGWRQDYNFNYQSEMLRSDIKTFSVKRGFQQPVWITIHVPQNSKAGKYKGTLTITANNMKAQTVNISLHVWPFSIPKFPSLKNAVGIVQQSGEKGKKLAKMVTSHRINYSNIYEWKVISLQEREKYYAMGTNLFNLLRCKPPASQQFFSKLKQVYQNIKSKNPALLKNCYVYGFDEVQAKNAKKMEIAFGKVKAICNNIKTMCALNSPIWGKNYELKNLDIWVLTLPRLSSNLIAKLHKKGHEVWWYNLYCKDEDPVGCRSQFWGTFKDKLDGVLFYNLKAGSEGRYQENLYPTQKRPRDGAFDHFGLIRTNQKGFPISTVAFEYWREGMEDYDYIMLLDSLKNKLKRINSGNKLIKKAEHLLIIPDYLTKGIVQGYKSNAKDGCLYDNLGTSCSMSQLLEYRKKIAEVIIKLQNAVNLRN
jgi:hypothetical protein